LRNRVFSRSCLDSPVPNCHSTCQIRVPNPSEAEPMLRSVSEGEASVRCHDFGGFVAGCQPPLWTRSKAFPLQWYVLSIPIWFEKYVVPHSLILSRHIRAPSSLWKLREDQEEMYLRMVAFPTHISSNTTTKVIAAIEEETEERFSRRYSSTVGWPRATKLCPRGHDTGFKCDQE